MGSPRVLLLAVLLLAASVVSIATALLVSRSLVSNQASPAPGVGEAADAAAAAGLAEVIANLAGPGETVERTQLADIDGDGNPEALVSVRKPGEDRRLDWYLFRLQGEEAPRELFSRKGVLQGEVEVAGPRIVESEGLYGEGDAPCCPSRTKHSFYAWERGALTLVSTEVSPAGAAP